MHKLFWVFELILMGTPSVFPDLPFAFGVGLYLLAAFLALLVCVDFVRSRGWQAPAWLTLGRLSPISHDLMPLIELRNMAVGSGWDFGNTSRHPNDLVRALDEAGVRGLLTFYARDTSDTTNPALLRSRPRKKIKPDDWENLRFGIEGIAPLSCDDNMQTRLYRMNPYNELAYSDVHVERAAVKQWLKGPAAEFKGKHDAERKRDQG